MFSFYNKLVSYRIIINGDRNIYEENVNQKPFKNNQWRAQNFKSGCGGGGGGVQNQDLHRCLNFWERPLADQGFNGCSLEVFKAGSR